MRGLTACLRRARVPSLLQGLLRSGSPAAARLCAAQNAVRPPAVPRRGAVALCAAVRSAPQQRAGRSARGKKRRFRAAYVARAPPAADPCSMRGCVYMQVFVFAPAKASRRARETLVTRARVDIGRLGCGTLQDDLATMFQSAGTLTFDLNVSDNENLAIAGSKVQKVRAPAVARSSTMISAKEHNCRVD